MSLLVFLAATALVVALGGIVVSLHTRITTARPRAAAAIEPRAAWVLFDSAFPDSTTPVESPQTGRLCNRG